MSILRANLLLLLTAAIWGLAFVAQRVGMEHLGPFTFNGVRFMLGSLSLLPLLYYFRLDSQDLARRLPSPLLPGLLAGVVLFAGASLQQIGMVTTTAGKAAFITSLYIVLVPLAGIFLGHRISRQTWMGCILALVGLYLLCVRESFSIQPGDLAVLAGAFFWTLHILIIGYYSVRVDVLRLSCIQFLTCSVLSMAVALVMEPIIFSSLLAAAIPILYGGICSVGIAYTLQVVGQKYAQPAHAAIILSLEAVFAVFGGFLLLGEQLQMQETIGCLLMLSGLLVSQLQGMKRPAEAETSVSG